ncbi:MAG: RagB/SusD family nutrient uptake outer membrane protein [Prolixibacteraceae bacterium]
MMLVNLKYIIPLLRYKHLVQLLSIAAILSSCTFFFEPEETSVSKIEDYDQLVDATNGVYGQLCAIVGNSEFYGLNANADDLYHNIHLSNLFYSTFNGFVLDRPCGSPENIYSTDYVYIGFYRIIASINNVLDQHNSEKIKQNEINELLGELYFLRAYCYFRLTRTYGRIPLILDSDVTYTNELSSFTEIYETIEFDLLKAVQLLPGNQSRVDYQTPHQGAAKALLAEVYLSWAGYPVKDPSKYELAAGMAKEVIDRAENYQFELLPDFADLWSSEGRYNRELIFSIYNPTKRKSGAPNPNIYSMQIEYFYGVSSGSIMENPGTRYSSMSLLPEVNFFNRYPEGYRKDQTFFNHIYVPYSEWWNPTFVDTGFIYINKIEPCSRVAYKKFYRDTSLVFEQQIRPGIPLKKEMHVGNPRICLLRYAQTLLTYAEAAAREGKLDPKAYECVNIIRRRANKVDLFSPSNFDLPPGLTAEAFADSVVQERAWELAGEPEGRWFDLLRLDKIDEVMSTVNPNEDNSWYRHNVLINHFLPLPDLDVVLNPKLEGTKN